jgi:hypothetical protein
MSNHPKNANVNERDNAKDADSRETGESQDALRHQQDAAHHKGYKSPDKTLPIDSDPGVDEG